MSDLLRRWLVRQESTGDDIAGGVIVGVAIVLIFRFLFDDPWAFSVLAGVATAVVSAIASSFTRRRRAPRGG